MRGEESERHGARPARENAGRFPMSMVSCPHVDRMNLGRTRINMKVIGLQTVNSQLVQLLSTLDNMQHLLERESRRNNFYVW